MCIRDRPVTYGTVNGYQVKALRDTGCNVVVVREKFVPKRCYVGDNMKIRLLDGTVIEAPLVNIDVDTPYYVGRTTAAVLPEVVYDLVIGNVKGALPLSQPNLAWESTVCRGPRNVEVAHNISSMLVPIAESAEEGSQEEPKQTNHKFGMASWEMSESYSCLLYTSDAADERSSVDLG